MNKFIYNLGICLLLFGSLNILYCQSDMIIIDGGLQLGDPNLSVPPDGTIRWSGSDYEGWMDGGWVSLTNGNNSSSSSNNVINDIDGNRYLTVVIGTQTWMRENLKTSSFNDGTPIIETSLSGIWSNNIPAWSWYHNNNLNDNPYGKLYNGYVVDLTFNGNKNVCPIGWHVPTDNDWTILIDYLNGSMTTPNIIGIQSTTVGGFVKMMGSSYWSEPNNEANNDSGFSALPAGLRNPTGGFGNQTQNATFWTSSKDQSNNHFVRQLSYSDGSIYRKVYESAFGFSIRCVKD